MNSLLTLPNVAIFTIGDEHMPKKTPSEFVTREEAAKMLGVTTRTIDRYADEKRLTRYKASIGRRILFKRSEVERLRDEPPLSKE